MLLSKDDKALIRAVESKVLSFSEACAALRLDPASDLVGGDFSYVDFSNSNLAGFNFTDADLSYSSGANIRGSSEAKFNGANLKGSPFKKLKFDLPFRFESLIKYTGNYEPFKIIEVIETEIGLFLSNADKLELLRTLLQRYYDRPDIMCSALWLIDSTFADEPERFDVIDSLIKHPFPAVCIEALKAAERCVSLSEINDRYAEVIYGDAWKRVRYSAFKNFENENQDPFFQPGKPATDESWLDPIDIVKQIDDPKGTLHVYLQHVQSLEALTSQNGYMTSEGSQFFGRFARKSNLLFRFDKTVKNIKFKKYYGNLNKTPTIDFYRRIFYMPTCFNLLNLLNPQVLLQTKLTTDFLHNYKIVISSDNDQFELFQFFKNE